METDQPDLHPRADGAPVAKAGVLAAVLWVAGVGARMAFAFYATHGGGPAIGRFMIAHDITSAQAWVACLVLMALLEVVSRSGILAAKSFAIRWRRADDSDAVAPARAGLS